MSKAIDKVVAAIESGKSAKESLELVAVEYEVDTTAVYMKFCDEFGYTPDEFVRRRETGSDC